MQACKASKLKILLTMAYILLLMGSSLIPMHEDVRTFRVLLALKPAIQNLLHIPALAILSILCLQVLSYATMERTRKIILVLGFTFAFGILNELVQAAIPGRYPGILDITLNFLGCLLGIALYMAAERRRSGLIRRVVCG